MPTRVDTTSEAMARVAAARLASVIEANRADTAVPACPGLDLAQLGYHVASAVHFWSQMASGVAPGVESSLERPADEDVAAWIRPALDRALGELYGADPAAPMVFSLTDDLTAGFAQRRIAHELTVHAWDAASAVRADTSIDPSAAVDGVDEYLEVWMGGAFGDRSGETQTVHLHATDLGGTPVDGLGEWHVTVGDDELAVTHEHAKGDIAVRGRAQDLLLLLWGLVAVDAPDPGAPDLEVFGDPSELARFVARVGA